MPRFVFVKTPVERKPFYVDFHSPVYVDMLARSVRRARDGKQADQTITVVEMVPDINQTWLLDAEGNSYTNELRIVAVDTGG